MCSSFTWGTVSVHYVLGPPLAYALRSATPNGLMLLVNLTYSPVMLRPIESFYLPRCSILSPSNLVHCVLFSPLPHDTLSCSIVRLLSVFVSFSPGGWGGGSHLPQWKKILKWPSGLIFDFNFSFNI